MNQLLQTFLWLTTTPKIPAIGYHLRKIKYYEKQISNNKVNQDFRFSSHVLKLATSNLEKLNILGKYETVTK